MTPTRANAYSIDSVHLALHFARKAEAATTRAQAALSNLQDATTLIETRYPIQEAK